MNKKNAVNSHNEWDSLKEVIVGSVKHAAKMGYEPSVSCHLPLDDEERNFKGDRYPEEEIAEAEAQLDNFAKILEKQGVIVRRPDVTDHYTPAKTPDFEIPCGICTACPRDVLLIIGNEIIEAPMGQRARFFEYRAYRSLIKEYFRSGAKWSAAPKPLMSDELYVNTYSGEFENKVITPTDFEPCFDAASFVRFGKDIFYQADVVTNDFGAEWLKRHLGNEYRIHKTRFAYKNNLQPQHIDTTLVPLREGMVLTNPEKPCIDGTLDLFKQNNWKIIDAPFPKSSKSHSTEVSCWISMNMLSVSEDTVVVEENEEPMIKFLESLDFKVITCPFDKVYKFGGSFHCCTTDIKREGTLKSYFPSLD